MRCASCGYSNTEDALFCRNCGAKLTKPIQKKPKKPVNPRVSPNKKRVLAVVAGILIVTVAAAGVYFYLKNKDKNELYTFKGGEEAPAELSMEDRDKEGIHSYSYVLADCGWNEAFSRARDAGGYLAHINSEEEFDYITEQLKDRGYDEMQFFIGSRREAGAQDYYWIDDSGEAYGEPLNDILGGWFWMASEPSYSNKGIEEEYLNIFYYRGEGRWIGNDTTENPIVQVPEFQGHVGYIVEFDE